VFYPDADDDGHKFKNVDVEEAEPWCWERPSPYATVSRISAQPVGGAGVQAEDNAGAAKCQEVHVDALVGFRQEGFHEF
jgi:hypothetical protein